MAAPGKQYGLFFPKKLQQKNTFAPKHSAFADDSDDETSVGESLKKEALKKRVMMQTKLGMQRALEEDPSVYEYDSIYDDLQKKKEEDTAKLLSGQDKKPKYIQNILKAVEVRKKEQEKRMEKKIQKEREMEGDEFKDKEAFVTTAYKKKLQEKSEEEERERKEAELETSLDVTKQKDLSGFYRHLLNQTVGEEKAPECSLRDTGVKEEKPRGYPDEVNNTSQQENIDADSDLGTESSEEEDIADKKPSCKSGPSQVKISEKTYYRPRHSSSSSEEQDNHKGKERKKSEESRLDKDRSHRDYSRERREEFDEKPRHGEPTDKDRQRKREESDSELGARERREHKSNKDGKRDDGRHKKDEAKHDKDRERGKKHKDRMDDGKGRDRNVKDYRHKEYGERSDKDYKDRSERPYEHKLERGEKIERDCERRSERDNKDRFHSERGERSERERGGRSERERGGRSERERGEKSDRECMEKLNSEDTEVKDKQYKDKKHSESNKKRSTSPFEMPPKNESKSDGGGTQNVDNSSTNKFAKRSNEGDVVSARDRYLARQMARVKTKAYVEIEED